jgi:hypothetical protein
VFVEHYAVMLSDACVTPMKFLSLFGGTRSVFVHEVA